MACFRKKYYSKVTNISDGIFNGYYAEYKNSTKIVLYQYKSYNEYEEVESVNCYISMVDGNFNYQYEFDESDFKPKQSDVYRLYKLIERKASGIDNIINNIINDFGNDDFDF